MELKLHLLAIIFGVIFACSSVSQGGTDQSEVVAEMMLVKWKMLCESDDVVEFMRENFVMECMKQRMFEKYPELKEAHESCTSEIEFVQKAQSLNMTEMFAYCVLLEEQETDEEKEELDVEMLTAMSDYTECMQEAKALPDLKDSDGMMELLEKIRPINETCYESWNEWIESVDDEDGDSK